MAWFSKDIYLSQVLNKSKKKLTDIRFYCWFFVDNGSGGKPGSTFNGFGFLINVVEHQSTSGTKIGSHTSVGKSTIDYFYAY